MLTCFKSEKASHAFENKKVFNFLVSKFFYSVEALLRCGDFQSFDFSMV